MKLKDYRTIFAYAVRESFIDNIPRLGAAFAFYALLSFAPLLLFLSAFVGLFLGNSKARDYIVTTASQILNREGVNALIAALHSGAAIKSRADALAVAFNIALLIFSSFGAFNELQGAFNVIWKVQMQPGKEVMQILRQRLFSFLMIAGTALLILASLIVNTALALVTKFAVGVFPATAALIQIVNLGIGFAVTFCLFAWMFRNIPDTRVRWKDVWLGALLAALLYIVGQWAISFYLGHSNVASRYGAAGSLIAFLIWIYYTAQILFLGAEVSHAHAACAGSSGPPKLESSSS